jgi:Uma2 family endonuclease
MSSLPIHHVTPEEYLEFERASKTKHEYIVGEIVAMAGGSPRHSAITSNAIRALGNQLANKPCTVFDSNLKVRLHQGAVYAYPDASVVCGKPEHPGDDDDVVLNPKLIVEVLSPTTRNYDLGDKARAYLEIPSLTDLLFIEQKKPWVEHWFRTPDGDWSRKVFSNPGDVLKVASLDCELSLTEIYSKVEFED